MKDSLDLIIVLVMIGFLGSALVLAIQTINYGLGIATTLFILGLIFGPIRSGWQQGRNR